VRGLVHWIKSLFKTGGIVSPSRTPIPSNLTVIYVKVEVDGPLRQSEILTNVVQQRQSLRTFGAAIPELQAIRHPYAIVITQDCDLEQDFKARRAGSTEPTATDKLIPNVLLLEAITVTDLLPRLSGNDIRRRVRQNKDERYHVLEKVETAHDVEGIGLPALGADFKRYFTVPTDELYAQLNSNAKRRTCLASPYLEHLTKRFADFQSRVALPKEHKID
jgi:hypothetical protein